MMGEKEKEMYKLRILMTAVIAIYLAFTCGLVEASNVHVTSDPQEITSYLSGYDIKSVTFTLDANDTLTIEIEPYGVPGDTDGDSNPDATSNTQITDDPGVGSSEFIQMGMNCANPENCVPPEALIIYTNNTLIVQPPPGVECNASMALTPEAYVLTISDFSVVKAAAGGTSTSFSAFSFSASFSDQAPEDFAPDADPVTFMPNCDQISLEPPVVTKDPFDCYAINKVIIKDVSGTTKDQIKVQKAGVRFPFANVDMNTAPVQIRIDGLAFDFAPGSFVKNPDKLDYVFKSASGVKPSIDARLNFDKSEWQINVTNGDATLIDNSDGVDVALVIDGYESTENVVLTPAGGNRLVYSLNPKTSCNTTDDGIKLSCIASLTLQHSSGRIITKTTAEANLYHRDTVFTDDITGDMAIVHTSCSECLHCGDVYGNFTIVEMSNAAGDRMSGVCGDPDASCGAIPEIP